MVEYHRCPNQKDWDVIARRAASGSIDILVNTVCEAAVGAVFGLGLMVVGTFGTILISPFAVPFAIYLKYFDDDEKPDSSD